MSNIMEEISNCTNVYDNFSTIIHFNFKENSEIEIPSLIVIKCCSHVVPLVWFGFGIKVLIAIFTIILNSLIILSIIFVPSLHKPSNYLIFSLAVSDLLIGIVVMPVILYLEISCELWPAGRVLCDIWLSVDMMCCSASIFNMTAIAIDRYISIASPMNNSQVNLTSFHAILAGIGAWILAGIVTVPVLFGFGIRHNDPSNEQLARCYLPDSSWCRIIWTTFGFFIPLALTIFAYVKIIRIINVKQHGTSSRPASLTDCGNTDSSKTNQETVNEVNDNKINAKSNACSISVSSLSIQQNSSEKKNFGLIHRIYRHHKGTAILGSLMIAFVICWAPFSLFLLFNAICNILEVNFIMPIWIVDFILWFGYVNSTINPIVLCFLFKDFRVILKEIVCFRCFTISEKLRENIYKKQTCTF